MKIACEAFESPAKNTRNIRFLIVLADFFKYDVNKLFYINIVFLV